MTENELALERSLVVFYEQRATRFAREVLYPNFQPKDANALPFVAIEKL